MPQNHLVLHFDVNKTILVDDKVQGIDTQTSCAQMLYWSSWGHCTRDGRSWVWNGQAPSLNSEDPTAMLYGDFVREQRTPRRHLWRLKRDFVKPGQPGEALRPYFDGMMEALAIPDEARGALESAPWAKRAGLTRGWRRLLPSFLSLLQNLRSEGRRCSLVFRTFGSDLPEVALELNAFCEGRHPLYPGVKMDGTTGPFDMRLDLDDPERFGAFHRGGVSGDDADAFFLALGTLDNPTGRDKPPFPSALDFFTSRAHRGVEERVPLRELTMSGGCIGLRDDYAHWARARFSTRAGKPFYIDPTQPGVHEVFFDDNVFADEDRIVDARDVKTGAGLPSHLTRGAHVVRVSPFDAIMKGDYFVEALRLAEALRSDTA